MELNPNDPFEAVVLRMVEVNRAKRADYAGNDDPFRNFYDSAYQLDLTAGHAVETLISTKQSRLKTLLPRYWNGEGPPQNEGIEDSILDRAVYGVIALALWKDDGYNQ